MVFIHGSGCNKVFLNALADETKEYNCYLLDLHGHDGSDDTGYNLENYVESISNFVKDLNNVILIMALFGRNSRLISFCKKSSKH